MILEFSDKHGDLTWKINILIDTNILILVP